MAALIIFFSHKVHRADEYYIHPFESGEPLQLDGESLEVIPTPGHTKDSVSLKVATPGAVGLHFALHTVVFTSRNDIFHSYMLTNNV
jgi:glyoxylase-like metal-dependent hydrolase (beta-lactamase superfamily II)